MQPLEQRSPSPRFTLETPIPTYQMDELLLVSHLYSRNVVENTIDDDSRDERRARLVRLVVCACALARIRGLVVTIHFISLIRLGLKGRFADC